MLGNMDAGGAMRALRTAKRTNESSADSAAEQRDGHHASLGRLLRLIADPRSDASHIEAAIQHHSKGGETGQAEKFSPLRVLALSDHRHISNIGTVLHAVDRAIALLSADATPTSDASAARNLLQALATTLATQSVSECTSTKHNVCVWTASSNKRLKLLEWILYRGPTAFRIVVGDALCGALIGDKTSQLTASLVVFELAQRQRRRSSGSFVSGEDWCVLLDPLVHAVKIGTVQTTGGPKASKLGVAALDALVAVLCLVVPSPDQRRRVLETMIFALSTLVQWNARSARRQWLLVASRQLTSMVRLGETNGTSETYDMVAWHWNASAMWLCARSDSVVKVKKTLANAFARSVDDLYGLVDARNEAEMAQHKALALLRQLCTFLSLHTGNPAELLSSTATQGKLLIALVAFMPTPTTQAIAACVLRRLVIGQPDRDPIGAMEPVLLLSRIEVEAFVAMIQRRANENLNGTVASILAELILRTDITRFDNFSPSDSAAATFWLAITDRALDLYSAIPAFDRAMQTQWLQDTTNIVLDTVCHSPVKTVRSRAVTLMPKLDLALCIQFVVSTVLLEVDTATSGRIVAFLFECAERQQKTVELVNVFVDSLCRGVPPLPAAVTSPSGFGDKISGSDTDGEKRHAVILAKSRDGWCMQVTRTTQTAILSVLIGKIFGSPRGAGLVTWLRELSLLGWFDAALADVLPLVTTQMKNVEKLTEELLEDESPSTSRAVEHLLFARLAPSLVLRVIPRSAFLSLYTETPCRLLADQSNESLSDLVHTLWSQMVDPLEYKEVKMLSIELLTKLPVHEIIPRVLEQLTAFASSQGTPLSVIKVLAEDGTSSMNGGGFVTAKLLVYYLNLIFTDESIDARDLSLLDRTLSVLSTVLSVPCPPNEAFSAEKSPLVDLQMGTIECLSLLVVKSIRRGQKNTEDPAELRLVEDALVQLILSGASIDATQSYPIVVQDKGAQDRHLPIFQSWRTVVQDACGDHHDRLSVTQVRICCCNILLSALTKLDAADTHVFQERILRTKILPSLQSQQLPVPVLGGCLQIAFSFFFKAGPSLQRTDPSAEEITSLGVAAVIQILQHVERINAAVSMNALKLLGALVGKVPWLWPSLVANDDNKRQAIATGLQNLRDNTTPTTSAAVRQLAQSLLQAITSG